MTLDDLLALGHHPRSDASLCAHLARADLVALRDALDARLATPRRRPSTRERELRAFFAALNLDPAA